MSRMYYIMSYRPVLPYLVLIRESVVHDSVFEEWIAVAKKIADNTGTSIIVLENLPTVYLKERQIGNHAVYEFVDNNNLGEVWLK
jgi:hypothetical protein